MDVVQASCKELKTDSRICNNRHGGSRMTGVCNSSMNPNKKKEKMANKCIEGVEYSASELQETRNGQWYIAIEAKSCTMNDRTYVRVDTYVYPEVEKLQTPINWPHLGIDSESEY